MHGTEDHQTPREHPMSPLPFLPNNTEAPQGFRTTLICVRPLTIHDLDADYDAVMSSLEHLQQTTPFGPDHDWPTAALTRDQDLIDLGWHQKEFQNGSSFAYTVMDPDGIRCLGCVYVFPSDRHGHDAQIILWVRASEVASGLDEHLYDHVREWIGEQWPFESPAYPGRSLTWDAWNALPSA
ncbi:MAG: GNAT family N-acetyltransferase [Phycisphaerae bacterium]|nr:GNAT family N-acetyltransferase [Phycisphaerae bacterium]